MLHRGTKKALAVALLFLSALAIPTRMGLRAQEGATVSPSQVERKNRAPVSRDMLRVKLPKPVEVKLKNGLTVLVLGFLPAGLFGLGPAAALALVGAAHAALFAWLSRPSERRAPLPAA